MKARSRAEFFAFFVRVIVSASPAICCIAVLAQSVEQSPCSQAVLQQTERDSAHGSPAAKKRLADEYSSGQCVSQDIAKAAILYRESAELGDSEAQYEFALYVLEGKEVPMDPVSAAQWLERSAVQNNPRSQYALGSLYVQGRGVSKNLIEGYKWIRISGPETDRHTNDVLAMVAKSMTVDQVNKAKVEAEAWRKAHRSISKQTTR